VSQIFTAKQARETLRLVDQAVTLYQLSFDLPPQMTFYGSADDRQDIPVFQEGADHDAAYAGTKYRSGA